jgi:hypothetical protein
VTNALNELVVPPAEGPARSMAVNVIPSVHHEEAVLKVTKVRPRPRVTTAIPFTGTDLLSNSSIRRQRSGGPRRASIGAAESSTTLLLPA